MKTTIKSLTFIGKNGEGVSEDVSMGERRGRFPPAGIVKVVALAWETAEGVQCSLDLLPADQKISWEILPDRSGLVVVINSQKLSEAYVLNADKSVRFKLDNPLLDSEFYEAGDECGFSYPAIENNELGCYAYIWSPSKTQDGGGVSAEHLFSLDASTGRFVGSHRVK
jgi:hypothetical protein